MTDAAMWALVVGFVSATFVLPVIQQPSWNARVRALVTFFYSIAVGLGTVFFTDGFGVGIRPIASTILLTLVTAISTYKGFAQPTGVAPAIEASTSPDPAPPRA